MPRHLAGMPGANGCAVEISFRLVKRAQRRRAAVAFHSQTSLLTAAIVHEFNDRRVRGGVQKHPMTATRLKGHEWGILTRYPSWTTSAARNCHFRNFQTCKALCFAIMAKSPSVVNRVSPYRMDS
jgi:hypothetical protein